jgi:hypothetical protein
MSLRRFGDRKVGTNSGLDELARGRLDHCRRRKQQWFFIDLEAERIRSTTEPNQEAGHVIELKRKTAHLLKATLRPVRTWVALPSSSK